MSQISWIPDVCDYNTCRVNVDDELAVIRQKENSTYACDDHILCRKVEEMSISAGLSASTSSNSMSSKFDKTVSDDDDKIDSLCRITMCEWCYRIVDHIGARRELVEISMNFLDRFLDKFSCDRTAYKLVAITSMYLAIKLSNQKSLLTMKSLSTLSKGEFSVVSIAEMERIILRALSWNLYPPTSANCIYYYYQLLPSIKVSVKHTILQRSSFFAELAVMECNPNWKPSQIAFSAILNALDGLDASLMSNEQRKLFIAEIEKVSGVDNASKIITSGRQRIWSLYTHSAQFELHDSETYTKKSIVEGIQVDNERIKSLHNMSDMSPVCVGNV